MRDAEVSLRTTQPGQHDLVVRRIGCVGFGLYASPAYLERYGESDFAAGYPGHRLITQVDDIADAPQAGWLGELAARAGVALQTSSHEAAVSAALHAAGLAYLARFRADREAGLTRILTPSSVPHADLWLVVHRDSRQTPRVSVTLAAIATMVRVCAPATCILPRTEAPKSATSERSRLQFRIVSRRIRREHIAPSHLCNASRSERQVRAPAQRGSSCEAREWEQLKHHGAFAPPPLQLKDQSFDQSFDPLINPLTPIEPLMPIEANQQTGDVIVPLLIEELEIARRRVPVTQVRVTAATHKHEKLIDELLTHERAEVERVAIGRPIDAAPPVREEGDTIVVPVVEEVVTLQRSLVLKEEIHIRRVRTTERHRETVTLRAQEAKIDRLAPDMNAPKANVPAIRPKSRKARES